MGRKLKAQRNRTSSSTTNTPFFFTKLQFQWEAIEYVKSCRLSAFAMVMKERVQAGNAVGTSTDLVQATH
jgi:hypothetical protein